MISWSLLPQVAQRVHCQSTRLRNSWGGPRVPEQSLENLFKNKSYTFPVLVYIESMLFHSSVPLTFINKTHNLIDKRNAKILPMGEKWPTFLTKLHNFTNGRNWYDVKKIIIKATINVSTSIINYYRISGHFPPCDS